MLMSCCHGIALGLASVHVGDDVHNAAVGLLGQAVEVRAALVDDRRQSYNLRARAHNDQELQPAIVLKLLEVHMLLVCFGDFFFPSSWVWLSKKIPLKISIYVSVSQT